ncbi:GspH/FimT family pseudopilin [Pseudomonas sp. RIT-PI-AD]|uniref:GspH/FimT family pseudopilin n=1 Tax=Pseudomonas sp. RIT-PI-AD TaxID=3035294 RepID=UPI0021DA000A|nr:GspH/FimT family pseudopilin [Pseudomonas sp. RIT-PI-AD]
MHHAHQKALGLIELLFCLALLAVFASLALPAFGQWVERTRLEALRDQLQAHLNSARADSVLHNRAIEVCGSADGQTCDDDWQSGWVSHFASDQRLLKQYRLGVQDRLAWTGASSRIRFQGNGTAPLGNGRFFFCDRQGKVVSQLVLNRQGRIRRVQGLEQGQNPQTSCN